jgi:hypothetical protein
MKRYAKTEGVRMVKVCDNRGLMIFTYISRQLKKFQRMTRLAGSGIRRPAAARTLLLGLAMSLLMGSLLAVTSLDARSRTVLDLDTRTQPVSLQDWGDYWIDTIRPVHTRAGHQHGEHPLEADTR